MLAPLLGSWRKRIVKTLKLYFHDTGLLCHLLGIRNGRELEQHPLRGAIFETWVISEVVKWHRHRGLPPRISFYRDRSGLEIDLIVEAGPSMRAVEIKSGATVAGDWFRALARFEALRPACERMVVYAGEERHRDSGATVVPWRVLHDVDWAS